MEAITFLLIFARSNINTTYRMAKKSKSNNARMQQVIKALSDLGGYARPIQIYKAMDCSGWGTRTPQATVRQKLQQARDQGLVVHCKDGHWCTMAYANQLEQLASQMHTLEQKMDVISRHETIVKIKDGRVLIEQRADATAAPQPDDKNLSGRAPVLTREEQLQQWATKQSQCQQTAALLEDYLSHKTGRAATIVIFAATKVGAITRPTYTAFDRIYPGAISKNKYYIYTNPGYRGYSSDELNAIMLAFSNLAR